MNHTSNSYHIDEIIQILETSNVPKEVFIDVSPVSSRWYIFGFVGGKAHYYRRVDGTWHRRLGMGEGTHFSSKEHAEFYAEKGKLNLLEE